MAKVLLTGDIHVAAHKDSLRRLQHCLDALKWVFETALEKEAHHIIFLGDLFQDREKIQVLPYQRTYEIIKKYVGEEGSPLKLHMLIGNHDMWFADKLDISSIIPLGSIPNVNIITKCETINIEGLDIDFLPFTLNPLDELEHFAYSQSPVLCGHIALHGAQLNTFYKTHADVSVEYEGDMVNVDAEKFRPWRRVFLGHYHAAQRIDNIEYVGSPLEINFAEAFQEKHLVLLDTETLETDYVINDFSPKHLIVKESELETFDLDNTFIKLEPKDISATNLVDLKKDLMESHNILTFEFSSPKGKEDVKTRHKIEDVQRIVACGQEEMLEEYIKEKGVPKGLDFDKLLATLKNICEKSQVE